MREEGDTTEEYSKVQRREREGASPRHEVESDEERAHTDRDREADMKR